MPESYGKRQRSMQRAKKFAAREERRAARKQQKADEAAGIAPASSWLGERNDQPVDAEGAPVEPAADETRPEEVDVSSSPSEDRPE
jgi:hypothetical protein